MANGLDWEQHFIKSMSCAYATGVHSAELHTVNVLFYEIEPMEENCFHLQYELKCWTEHFTSPAGIYSSITCWWVWVERYFKIDEIGWGPGIPNGIDTCTRLRKLMHNLYENPSVIWSEMIRQLDALFEGDYFGQTGSMATPSYNIGWQFVGPAQELLGDMRIGSLPE